MIMPLVEMRLIQQINKRIMLNFAFDIGGIPIQQSPEIGLTSINTTISIRIIGGRNKFQVHENIT